jgi:haloalkane dehalogenase
VVNVLEAATGRGTSAHLAEYPYIPKTRAINGHRMAYLDEGNGPPLVCVHGNPTWSYMYRNLVTTLQDRFRCIVPDHIGCGHSAKPQDYPYLLQNHIDNLESLLTGELDQPCLLVVHDWGGAIGMGWAGRCPELVAGIVVLNTAAFPSRHIPLRIAVCRWPLLGALLVRGLNGFAGAAVHMAVKKKLSPEVVQGFLSPYSSWRNRVAVHRFVQDIPMHKQHPSWLTLLAVENGLTRLQDKPMLLCWGGEDFCFHDHFYNQWRERFPQAIPHYFSDAGHYVLEDAGERILPLIADFAGTCLGRKEEAENTDYRHGKEKYK